MERIEDKGAKDFLITDPLCEGKYARFSTLLINSPFCKGFCCVFAFFFYQALLYFLSFACISGDKIIFFNRIL